MAAAHHAAPRLHLATGVAVAFPRSPMVAAQTAWELAELTGGQFRLGLGSQVKAHVERRYGSEFSPPVARMRDYVLAVKDSLAAFRGEAPLAHDGPYYALSLMSAMSRPRRHAHEDVKVDMAAVGDAMVTVAGEVADGIHVHPFHSMHYVREQLVPTLVAATERAGRGLSDVDLIVPVLVAPGDAPEDRAPFVERCRAQVAFYGSTKNYAFQFDDLGFDGLSARLNERLKAGDPPGMAALVTDEVLSHFAVVGAWADVADELVDRYGDLARPPRDVHRRRRHQERPAVGRALGRARPGHRVAPTTPVRAWLTDRCGDEPSERAMLKADADPADVGLDAGRLDRLDAHLARYVDDDKLPGWLVAVSRHGRLAHVSAYGHRDVEAAAPVETDTIWRIYSMTKPITAVAALVMWEQGRFALNDLVRDYIPSFERLRVWRDGTMLRPETDPLTDEMRIWHLFTHTSGFTYGFLRAHVVDALYRDAGFEWGVPGGLDLAGVCDVLADLPLVVPAGSGVELRHEHRRARARRRGRRRHAARRRGPAARARSARDGRHRVARARRPGRPPRCAVHAAARDGHRPPPRRDGWPGPDAAHSHVGRQRAVQHGRRLRPLRRDAALRRGARRPADPGAGHGALHGQQPPARRR